MIQITYPNTGLYDSGRPRFEVINDTTGEITSCRVATDDEALAWEQVMAVRELTTNIQILLEELRSMMTYGVRIAK